MQQGGRTRMRRFARIASAIRDDLFSNTNLQLISEIFGCAPYHNLSRDELKRFTFNCLSDITRHPVGRFEIDERDILRLESRIGRTEDTQEDIIKLERYIGKSRGVRQLLRNLSEKITDGHVNDQYVLEIYNLLSPNNSYHMRNPSREAVVINLQRMGRNWVVPEVRVNDMQRSRLLEINSRIIHQADLARESEEEYEAEEKEDTEDEVENWNSPKRMFSTRPKPRRPISQGSAEQQRVHNRRKSPTKSPKRKSSVKRKSPSACRSKKASACKKSTSCTWAKGYKNAVSGKAVKGLCRSRKSPGRK